MPDQERRLILAYGEKYVNSLSKPQHGQPPEYPRSYDEAREHVVNQVKRSLEELAALPANKRLADEAVFCLRLHPDMSAKSYDPNQIFALVPELMNVGSRNYRVAANRVAATRRMSKKIETGENEVTGRLVFVRSDNAGFRRFLQVLETPERDLNRQFRHEIQTIEFFDLLRPEEQLAAFKQAWPDWKEGRVEMILHPSRHSQDELSSFIQNLVRGSGTATSGPNFSYYENGPMFASLRLDIDAIRKMSGANPLRTAQPMEFGVFEDLRASTGLRTPPPPTARTRSTIKVGMFDGGIHGGHELLDSHVEEDVALSTKTSPDPRYVAHGTAVAGAILYGPLNTYDVTVPLPSPGVSVVSFRVLPTLDKTDIDLYEAIDRIEAAVPARPDIKVFNVSFGPRGPILDDSISRFTYALDSLSTTHGVLFCVAVGNDGEAGPDLCRIQAPADIANGLGVGAYAETKDGKSHAPYSCRGPGRECAKVKPDVAAFGGCNANPMHLVSSRNGEKAISMGTSFASPLAAALCAKAVGGFDRSTPLLGRALVVHTSVHPQNTVDHLLGYGIIASNVDELLRCRPHEVTIVYQGSIQAKQSVRLPILLPPGVVTKGNITIRWTVATLPRVSPSHPYDYTSMCLEDTFYPNCYRFTYSPPEASSCLGTKPRALHNKNDKEEIDALIAAGWRKSQLPVSDSGATYKTEGDRRASDLKWETIVRREKRKRAESIDEPFLVLHAIPRHGVSEPLDYAVVVSVYAPAHNGDLYDAVRRAYPALLPVRLRTEVEVRIQV